MIIGIGDFKLSDSSAIFPKDRVGSKRILIFLALENSFSLAMKFRMLVRMKEGHCLSPHAAPALSDDDVAPVRESSHRGGHSGGGETPLSVLYSLEFEHFFTEQFFSIFFRFQKRTLKKLPVYCSSPHRGKPRLNKSKQKLSIHTMSGNSV